MQLCGDARCSDQEPSRPTTFCAKAEPFALAGVWKGDGGKADAAPSRGPDWMGGTLDQAAALMSGG
jgi:hypothetical protein